MDFSMQLSQQLRKNLEEAAGRLSRENTDVTTINGSGMVLVKKDSPAHTERLGKVQYLGPFHDERGQEYVLFAG